MSENRKTSDAELPQGFLHESADFEAEAKRISEVRDPTERLLRAGVLALIHAGRAVLETGLSPEVITRTAGRSRRSFYDHFRGKQEFSEQMFDELLGIGGPTQARIDVAESLLNMNDGDLFDTLRLMATAPSIGNVERVNRVARQIVTALGSNDDYAQRRINDFYDRDRLVYEPVIRFLIESWGLDLREPWTTESATLFFRVIVDGYAMRSLVDPDTEETEAVFLVLKTMFLGMTRLRDSADTDSVDDRLRETSDMAQNYLRERSDPSVVLDARQVIQDATMSELAKRGYINTTLDLVARTAGISQVTIRRAMGDVDDICCELIGGLIAGLESAVELDLGSPLADDPHALMERHLNRLGALVDERRPLLTAISIMAVSPTSNSKAAVARAGFEAIFARLLREVVDAGKCNSMSDEEIVAASMATTRIFLHCGLDSEAESMVRDAKVLLAMMFERPPAS